MSSDAGLQPPGVLVSCGQGLGGQVVSLPVLEQEVLPAKRGSAFPVYNSQLPVVFL